MSFDEIVDLTAGVYFNFCNKPRVSNSVGPRVKGEQFDKCRRITR